jgi:spore maturation protein CgeB
MQTQKLRILLVAPGALHSTYDVWNGYKQAIQNHEYSEVVPFNYHTMLMYHREGVRLINPNLSDEDVVMVTASRASREILSDIAAYLPDIVMVISGIGIPSETWNWVIQLKNHLKNPFKLVFYHTESPYLDKTQVMYDSFSDGILLNDKYSLGKHTNRLKENTIYLPHSYNPKVHYPDMNREYTNLTDYASGREIDGISLDSDIFFCGTAFAERVDLFKQVNWSGIDLRLLGQWRSYLDEGDSAYSKCVDNIITANNYLADFYRHAKIALNIHRTRPDLSSDGTPINNHDDAYSIGPRLYEAAACGALIVSDYRQEIVDLFEDTAEIFDSPQHLQSIIDYWIKPENQERRFNKTQAAMEKIKHCTFDQRYNDIVYPMFMNLIGAQQ